MYAARIISSSLLIFSGIFALVLGVAGHFLPHDEEYLGMTARQLCALHGCRVVHFMVHDRVSLGGALLAVGLLYLWLTQVPLSKGEVWAWWLYLVTGIVGFGSFFAYLGYGYLDTWHGLATLGLFPIFLLGLGLPPGHGSIRSLLRPSVRLLWASMPGRGRALLLATAAGLVVGGFTIMLVGMTCVFVPQDLAFMGVSVEELHDLNPRLVPLIAHDRAGFGGAVCCCGVALFFSVWCGKPSRSLWQVLALVGMVGFGSSILVHHAVGYNDVTHLAPAVLGALAYFLGLVFSFRSMVKNDESAFAPGARARLANG